MNTVLQQHENQPLRRALLLDAVATGATGLALAVAATPLAAWFNLPVVLLREAGFILLAFVAFLAWLLTRGRMGPAQVKIVIAINAIWVIASLGLLASGWVRPTVLGAAFVIAQALVVAVFAELQYLGLRRAQRR